MKPSVTYSAQYDPFARGKVVKAATELRQSCREIPHGDAVFMESPLVEQLHFQLKQKALALRRLVSSFKPAPPDAQAAAVAAEKQQPQVPEPTRPDADASPQQVKDWIEFQSQRERQELTRQEDQRAIQLAESALQEADDCKWPGGEPHGSFGQTADYDPNAPVPIIRGGQTRWVHPDNAKPYSLEEADRQLHNTAAAINEVREAMTQVRMAQIDLEHGLGNVYITRESGLEKVQRLRSWLADKRRMLQNSLEDLQAYAEEAGGEIKRLEMNIDKLRSGGARVKSARAKDELELGKVQLTRKLEQHQRMFEHLHKQMTLAWRTLRESSSIGSVQGGRS